MAKFLLLLEGRAAQPSASDEQTQAYNRKWLGWIRSLAQAGTLESGPPLTPPAGPRASLAPANGVATFRPEPFRVGLSDDVLADLQSRIRRTRWPEAAPDAPWKQGTDLDYLRELL